jgi:hypothetical protein
MMKLGFTYLFLCAGKPRKNDDILDSLTCSCGQAKLGKMMKLGFTYLFVYAGEPRKNDEIRIHLPVPVCWKI